MWFILSSLLSLSLSLVLSLPLLLLVQFHGVSPHPFPPLLCGEGNGISSLVKFLMRGEKVSMPLKPLFGDKYSFRNQTPPLGGFLLVSC